MVGHRDPTRDGWFKVHSGDEFLWHQDRRRQRAGLLGWHQAGHRRQRPVRASSGRRLASRSLETHPHRSMNSSFKTTSWTPPDAKRRRPSARHPVRDLRHRRTVRAGHRRNRTHAPRPRRHRRPRRRSPRPHADLRPLSPNRPRWRWISCLKDDEIRGSRNSCRCHRERHTARCGWVAVRLIGTRGVNTAVGGIDLQVGI